MSIITTSRKLTWKHIGDMPFSQSQQAYKKTMTHREVIK